MNPLDRFDRETVGDILSLGLAEVRDNLLAQVKSAEEAMRGLCEQVQALPPPPAPPAPLLAVWPYSSSDSLAGAPLDAVLWRAAPTVCVPRNGLHVPLQESGHRFLVAVDGLWIEVRRPWLHLIYPVARQKLLPMPYGPLEVSIALGWEKSELQEFIKGFCEKARTALPNEHATWVSWAQPIGVAEGRLVWDPVDIQSATPGAVSYERPAHYSTCAPAIDLHSHGAGKAFFSGQDDTDDDGEVKIAVVVGNLDQAVPTIEARLCCLGMFIKIPVKPAEVFA